MDQARENRRRIYISLHAPQILAGLSSNPDMGEFSPNDLRRRAVEQAGALFDETEVLPRTSEARPIRDWTESNGIVFGWTFPITEPPYVGTPNDKDWPEYFTHWTPITEPADPSDL